MNREASAKATSEPGPTCIVNPVNTSTSAGHIKGLSGQQGTGAGGGRRPTKLFFKANCGHIRSRGFAVSVNGDTCWLLAVKAADRKQSFLVQVTGEEEPMYHARVTVASKVRKNDLPVRNGDTVGIIRTTSCPKGKWLARDASHRCELDVLMSCCGRLEVLLKPPPSLCLQSTWVVVVVGGWLVFLLTAPAVCRRLHFSHERGAQHQGDAGTRQEGPSGRTGGSPGGGHHQHREQVAEMLAQLA